MLNKKTYKLDDDVPQLPYRLIGIGTTLKYYTLCHFLNSLLHVDFQNTGTLSVSVTKDKIVNFPCLSTSTPNPTNKFANDITLTIFLNKYLGETLLPKLSNFDLLLKVEGEFDNDLITYYCEVINSIKGVLISADIDLEKVKNVDRLWQPE